MTVVLDTCALIWWSLDPDKLSVLAKSACEKMEAKKNGLVASISLGEIAIKIKNKKLDLGVSLTTYLEALQKSDVITIIPIDENLWLESVALERSHKDPADRVIVALAQKYQADLITADKIIMGFYDSVIW
ncbi:type II toxin-antitoxin system VapC family toxin [Trichormus variabilis]|uniref:Twitching motility protein PilT n=1 Tax=Trichormus variabilis SAG 1403-4b TaxID=447716 RepID=A0A3S1ACK8_ANAVA|nr:type II toxin-antitoxin system VapC family toxin [Trichormus variabilis]MBD2626215.1 type II toxin-antitoxin system VapC family toxin [Trichormus variabilis FACHB-164]RUS98167.1 twitching motility protein PilT [Trichormus variabilis SAG 1403-4b]